MPESRWCRSRFITIRSGPSTDVSSIHGARLRTCLLSMGDVMMALKH